MDRRLLVLCFGNFVIGTGTLIVPGMLSVLADGLGVGIPMAGRLIAAFALTVAIGAPLLAGATSRIDRRKLLVAMQVLFVAGHLLAAFAPDYLVVLIARVASASSAALFTSQSAATASMLAPPARRGAAIAFVFLGWSIASVIGMPLGAWIAATFGWRIGFALVAGLAVLAAIAVWTVLPAGLTTQSIDRAAWRRLAADPVLLLAISVTAVQAWGQFIVFSYFTPAFKAFIGADAATITGLLVMFGVTGIVGNLLAARNVDRLGASRLVALSILVMLAGHVLWLFAPASPAALSGALLLWGLGCFACNSMQQVRLMALAPTLAPVSVALNTSAIYLGQALGAETGGRLIVWSGLDHLAWASIPILAASLLLTSRAKR